MSESTLRTFIALTVPKTKELRELHGRLARLGAGLKPVTLTGLHVTLKFLGDTRREQLPEIKQLVEDAAGSLTAFRATLYGLGAFPHARRPSVVWVGMRGADGLASFVERLEQEVSALGFTRDGMAFHPHVTILRVKNRPPERLFEMLEELAATEFGAFDVTQIDLYQSKLRPEGSEYKLLASSALTEHGKSQPEA